MAKTNVKPYIVRNEIIPSDVSRYSPKEDGIDVVVPAAADFGANFTDVRAILYEASDPADHPI
jgi:hypothetical protein